jgi:AbrB family looped-hinge helix DNA binding protein
LTVRKYPKIVQADTRGQVVIPKDIRNQLGIEEGTGFYMYSIGEEGILLKKIPASDLAVHKELIDELKDKAGVIGIKKESVDDSLKRYKKSKERGLELL